MMEPNRIEYVFEVVAKQLPKAGVRFLMIGGHAVNHYGYSRATIDVDFMIATNDMAAVRSVMKGAGFNNISESENVIFFGHPENPYRVDFLQIDSESMQKLLGNSEQIKYAGVPMEVPSLHDLVAMKLFALRSGSARREEKDFPDIVNLVLLNGLDVEKDLKPLCDRFANEQIFNSLILRIQEENHG